MRSLYNEMIRILAGRNPRELSEADKEELQRIRQQIEDIRFVDVLNKLSEEDQETARRLHDAKESLLDGRRPHDLTDEERESLREICQELDTILGRRGRPDHRGPKRIPHDREAPTPEEMEVIYFLTKL